MVLYLVDDEKNIRESIKTYIPWGDFGVTQVITAKSGIEALEKMLQLPPDVVLSDIRMPKMNGIEFASKLKELYPDCVILFLSGYADKEYLKSAITLEAFQFIEKPIDINSLQAILTEAVSKKKKLLKNNEHLNALEKSHSENLHVIRQNLINQLISSDTPINSSKSDSNLLKQIGFKSFIIAYIKFNWPTDITDSMLYDLKNSILRLTLSEEWINSALPGFNTENNLIILIDGSYYSSQVSNLLDSLTKQFSFSFTYSIGLSKTKNTIHNCRTAYLEAKSASDMQFYYGIKRIIEYYEFFYSNYELSSDSYEQFDEFLKNSDIDNLLKSIEDIYSIITKNKPPIQKAKSIYTTIITILDKEARKTNNPVYDFAKNKQIISEIDKAYLLRDIHELVVHHIKLFYESQTLVDSNNNRTREIMQYIKKSISDSQLSVNTIAKTFQLSQAYLCSYFKKETNMTLNQYITNVRMEQSKYLLTNTNDKIYDISIKVGYCDTNYFSALFKKQIGMTPLEYRKGM